MALGYQETLSVAQTDGTALSNTVTATSILPTHAKWAMPGGYMGNIGKTLRLRATGRISTVVTTPGTLTFDVRIGAVIVSALGAISLNTVAKTNVSWLLELEITLRAVGGGTSANALVMGQWQSEAVIASAVPTAGSNGAINLPASAPAVGTGFDATATALVDLFATWSVANAANSITLHQYVLEGLN